MTRQKSEDRVVPQGRRKSVPTEGPVCLGGGKAIPVNQSTCELGMTFWTAENELAQAFSVVGATAWGVPLAEAFAGPKLKVNEKMRMSAMFAPNPRAIVPGHRLEEG